jgi:hypothetical protein
MILIDKKRSSSGVVISVQDESQYRTLREDYRIINAYQHSNSNLQMMNLEEEEDDLDEASSVSSLFVSDNISSSFSSKTSKRKQALFKSCRSRFSANY